VITSHDTFCKIGILLEIVCKNFCDRNDRRKLMKKISGIELFIIMAMGLACSANAAITITLVGDGTGYDITGDEALNHLSTGVTKTLDSDGDNAYGTLGVFAGTDGTGGGGAAFTTATHMRSTAWATFSAGANFSGISEDSGSWGYGEIDDPSEDIATDVSNINSAVFVGNSDISGTYVWGEFLTFTVNSDAPQRFRVGVIGNNGNGDWPAVGYRISSDGGSTYTTVSDLDGTGETASIVFFDVDLKGATSGTFSISGQRGSNSAQGPTMYGLTFDELPAAQSLSLIAITSK
jgi:hypothetical protein